MTFHTQFLWSGIMKHELIEEKNNNNNRILTNEKESKVIKYILSMCDRSLDLSPTTLKMKVFEITRIQSIPFKNEISSDGWLRWFKKCHSKLIVRVIQALTSFREKELYKKNEQTFYDNLSGLHALHDYLPKRISNCDEFDVQA